MNPNDPTQCEADSGHPSLEQLHAFAVGQLPEMVAHEVEQHLAICTWCNQQLESSPNDSFVQLLQQGDTLVRGGAWPAVAFARALRFVPGYTLLEQLGQGAMGVVWKARQDGLDRVIALKRLRSAGAPSAEALARFRREAEAVARLRHVNIVQIYDVGEQDGEPYLALEYLAGGTLADKLASGPLLSAQAATLVETLARAMHYAHEHGIIHRDLKPSNVLLDEDGSAKISDFGLAKQLDEATIQTQTGAILGTPSYMAPEQAAGEKASVGPPADVYALGAILYESLTGRPPFRGPTVLDTLAQVREREPVPPRQLQPNIPRDLETICLKCLHKEPRKRYASAADLAEDLRCFRVGQPIHARRSGPVERLVKWARRKPAWAALGIVSVLALAALLGGGLWYQARLRVAVQQADTNRERADENYRHARQAINQMLDRLSKLQAPGVPQIEVLRRDLSKDAATFFQEIAQTEADADPSTRFDFAKSYFLLGNILFAQNQAEAGRKDMDHARRLLEQLCAEDPTNPYYRLMLLDCLEKLAVCAAAQDHPEESLRFRERVLEICQEWCRLEPDDAIGRRALAVAHQNLGGSCSDRSEQERHWKEAVRILEKLVGEHPESADDQYYLTSGYSNLAMLYRETGRIDEADAAYRKVEPRLTKLVREHADRKDWLGGLVQTLRNWGGMLVTARRGEEAGPLLDRGVAIVDNWIIEDPQNTFAQRLLIVFLVLRMHNSTLLHRPEQGDKDWKRALALSAKLKSWSDLCEAAWLDAHLGDHALTAARAEHLAKQKDLLWEDLYRLAKAFAQAVGAARKDSQLTPAERQRKIDGYAALTVRLLDRVRAAESHIPGEVFYDFACFLASADRAEKAFALLSKLRGDGFFDKAENLKMLRTDPDLDLLRKRSDFMKLVSDLGKPADRK